MGLLFLRGGREGNWNRRKVGKTDMWFDIIARRYDCCAHAQKSQKRLSRNLIGLGWLEREPI